MKKWLLVLFVAIFCFMLVSSASASLLLDRGLPTGNLNNTAGSNRSNVAWADWESTDDPAVYWLPGDEFEIAGSGSYQIDTIRVWSTDQSGLSLWFGPQGGTISHLADVPSVTAVTYENTASYQGNSGAFRQLYQVDFNVNLTVSAGTFYQFFLDGPWQLYDPEDANSGYVNAFLHSSNAVLSGSPQEGSDNIFLWLKFQGGLPTVVTTWDSNGDGWDKSSDGNVQIYGSPTPLPAALWLLGSGLVGLFGIRRRARH